MPVINGVYLKDFAALPGSVADANIIPIAITGNQVAYRTTVAGIITDARITGKLLTGLSVTGTAILATDTILEAFGKVQNQINNRVSSVGLTMPSAFSVANSPITTSGTLAVTAAGVASQYIRGDGVLATLPSGGGGGASVNYYLNGSVAASVGTYYQMSKTAVIGGGTDFPLVGNGLIAQFLTDVADPNSLLIPAGAWNFEMYFQVSSAGGNGKFYVELLKYNGSTFTSIANSSAVPEEITSGTTIDLYLTSIAVPATVLLSTDRLAIRVYIVDSTGGRTVTLHTEDNTLCQVTTTFAGGISALNGLTANTQYFATGTTGTDFAIVSSSDTHTFNLPNASATARGVVTTGTQTIAGAKTFSSIITIPDEAYSVAWNGKLEPTTKNAVWDALNGSYVPFSRILTINGTSYDLSADRTWSVGTVTSVAALTLGTTGTDLSSSVATGTTTPVITLNVPTASGTNRGALSSADWTTFNNKQGTITLTTTGTSGAATFIANTLNIPNYADGGVLSVGAIGASPNANGATISGTVLNLEPASESFGGVITTGTQTIAGAKTLTGALTGTTATFNGSTININSDNTYVIPNRSSTTWDAATVYRTAGVNNWLTGLRGGVTGYTIRNLSTGVDAILVDYITNAITLGGALTGTSATFSGDVNAARVFSNAVNPVVQAYSASGGEAVLRAYSGTNYWDFSVASSTLNFKFGGTTKVSIASDGALSGTSATFSTGLSVTSGAISLTPTTFAVGTGASTDGNSLTLQAANSNYLQRFKDAAGTSLGGFYFNGTKMVADYSGGWQFGGAITGTSATFSSGVSLAGDLTFTAASRSIVFNSTNTLLWESSAGALSMRTGGVDRLTIASTGAATFSGTLGINGTADNVKSGTYTPTLTNVTNVSSSTAYKSFYTRLGNIVTVMGSIVVTPTSTGNTRIDISLPIASALANNQDLAGQSTGLSGVASDGAIIADATNDRAQCLYIADAASGQTLMYSFSYEIK